MLTIKEKRDIVEWSFNLARKYLPDETLVINEGNPLFRLQEMIIEVPILCRLKNVC